MYVGELTIGNISCVFPGNNLFYDVYVFHDGMVRLRAVTSSGALSLFSFVCLASSLLPLRSILCVWFWNGLGIIITL